MLDSEAAEAQQCLRLTSDSDERHALQLRYGAALDNFGDVRWFGQRTHSIEYCSDDDGEDDTSGNQRRKARTRVTRPLLNGQVGAARPNRDEREPQL